MGDDRSVGQHHPGDLRRVLLDAAVALLEAGETPSLRAVARAAGVSPGAPYHHFESKSALLAAVAAEGFWALESALGGAAAREGEERLRAVVTIYVGFARANPARYRTLFDPDLVDVDGVLNDAIIAAFAPWVAAVVELAGDHDAMGRATRAWGLAHGLLLLDLSGTLAPLSREPGGQGVVDDVVEGVIDLVLRGR